MNIVDHMEHNLSHVNFPCNKCNYQFLSEAVSIEHRLTQHKDLQRDLTLVLIDTMQQSDEESVLEDQEIESKKHMLSYEENDEQIDNDKPVINNEELDICEVSFFNWK